MDFNPQDPFAFDARQYLVAVGISLLGGIVSWIIKVRKGETAIYSIMAFTGELCISAFSGIIAFWLLLLINAPPLLVYPIVGLAGHMGVKAITLIEEILAKRFGE